MRKLKKGMAGIRGICQKAWKELHSKNMTVTDGTIRCKSTGLVAATMKPAQDLDGRFLRVSLLWEQVENVGEPCYG